MTPGAFRLALRTQAFAIAAATCLTVACTPAPRLPDLEQIYRTTAAAQDANQRPLITVPGTLGSRLIDQATGTVIWGGSRRISADPADPAVLRLMALPIGRRNEPLAALRDCIRPDGILDVANVELLGLPLTFDIYGGVTRTLGAGGFLAERNTSAAGATGAPDAGGESGVIATAPPDVPKNGYNAFRFDYDWRRDLIGTAHEFGRFLEDRRRMVAKRRGVAPGEVRFDLLAHSMGGLVARYFLMYGFTEPGDDGTLPPVTWSGAEFFDRVVFIAPPNAGTVTALDNLVNGKSVGPFQPFYPAAMLATHPSLYQLLPRNRHGRLRQGGKPIGDIYDVALWQRMGWGLAAPEADEALAILMPDEPDAARRHARALAFTARLLRRAETFHRMMDRWAPPPEGLELFLVVGGGFETPAIAEIGADGAVEITGVEEGDGVVLRTSALLDERVDGERASRLRSPLRFKTTLFLPDEHIELTRNPVFGDNLLFWLLEAQRPSRPLQRPDRSGLYTTRPRDGAEEPAEPFTPGNEK